MKHVLLFLIGTTLLLALDACKKEAATDRVVTTNEAILNWNECVNFANEGLTVCFEGCIDQFCPCEANCLLEGMISATLRATDGTGLDSTFVLTTNSNPIGLVDDIKIGSKTIRFVSAINAAEPCFRAPTLATSKDYKATIVIE